MKGLRDLVDIRKSGQKPNAVWVELVKSHEEWDSLSRHGNLTIQIVPTDHLADIDFRPLIGLDVTVTDLTNNPRRLMAVGAAVGAVQTRTLTLPVYDSQGLTLHIRRGETTETHRL